MAVLRYQFTYNTPTPAPTQADPNATVDVPTTFALPGSVGEDVARGIRRGLRTYVATINNVSLTRVSEVIEVVTADPTP